MYPYRWRAEGKPVTMFTTSDIGELERAARLLRVVPLLRQTRLLVFLPMRGTPPACSPEEIKKRLGTEIVVVPQQRFDELLAAVDESQAKAEAERWISEAKKIIEPVREDMLKAARVSLALDQLVEEEQAQGLAVGTCMGWLNRGFPCLGFTRLRDRGIPASCEGDMDSLLTMMLFGYMFDQPGFQGNATFDTAKNAVWTAHCVGPLKMDGYDGQDAPYLLRSHSEIGGGVVPEIQYRIGQEITRTKLVNLDTLLISTGAITEVPDKSTRACRTQIVTEIGDANKMVRNWGGGVLEGDMMTLLHRVVFYGDHLQDGRHMTDLLGMQVVEEG
jgi:L-fucose isomerase-like protein